MARKLFRMVGLCMVLGVSAQQAAAADECPKLPLRAVMSTHTIPPYPVLAQRIGKQGPTRMMVDINTEGVPTHADVITSSGSLRLDDAAVAHVLEFWRWLPPTENCKPIAVKTLVNVVWNLKQPELPAETMANFVNEIPAGDADYPSSAKQKGEHGTSVVVVILGSDGKIVQASLIYGAGYEDLDEGALKIVRRLEIAPIQIMGRAAKSTTLIGIKWAGPPALVQTSPP